MARLSGGDGRLGIKPLRRIHRNLLLAQRYHKEQRRLGRDGLFGVCQRRLLAGPCQGRTAYRDRNHKT